MIETKEINPRGLGISWKEYRVRFGPLIFFVTDEDQLAEIVKKLTSVTIDDVL